MMKTPGQYQINSRYLTTFDSISNELCINTNKNYLFDLSHLGILNIEGDKAVDFLQGQLTCDVKRVSDIQIIQGAQCNLKGRILSLMDVINWNGIKIVLPKDLLEATHTSLAKTALLSRVSIKENKHLCIIGFYLQNPGDLLPHATFFSNELYAKSDDEHYCYYHLGNGFYIFVVKVTEKNIFFQAFSDKNQLLGSLTWHTLRLMNKQINIYPESRGLFLPHRSELHQTPLISFDKGCYKGQEIIARTHYRATLKHELRIYSINSDEPVHSGQKIYPVDEEIELGEVVDYSFLANNRYLIAISILKEAPTTIRLEGQTPSITLESASI